MTDQHNSSPIIGTPANPTFTGAGTFAQNTVASFFFYFTDITGGLYDPSDIDIEIFDSTGTLVKEDDSLDRMELGVFAYTWTIPATSALGKYTITIDYTSETIDGPVLDSFSQNFNVIEPGSGDTITLRQAASRAYLEFLIGEIQRIPIINERLIFNKAKLVGQPTFPRVSSGRWNQTAGVKIRVNGEPKESGFSVDYFKGNIIFTNPISDFDDITIDYNMRWFTDEELDNFIQQGVNKVNLWTPQTTYTIENIEDRWIIAAEYAAAVDVYRRWMSDILFQEPAQIFGGMQRSNEVFGHLESLKKNYEEDFYKMIENKKYGPYAGLTKTTTTPEFTLPGGRSRWFRYLFKGAMIFLPLITHVFDHFQNFVV